MLWRRLEFIRRCIRNVPRVVLRRIPTWLLGSGTLGSGTLGMMGTRMMGSILEMITMLSVLPHLVKSLVKTSLK